MPNDSSNQNEPKHYEAERLLRRAHDGDREALGSLLKLYRRHMSLMARSQVDPRLQIKVDASDFAQDACLEAHRHFDRFQGTTEAEFGAWMRKILAGLVANSVRRYKGTKQRDLRRERPFAAGASDSSVIYALEAVARDGTPSEHAVKRETSARLAQALEELPAHYRQVIELRNREGLSFAEIAAEMGRSTDSVEKLWLRALEKLRRLLRRSSETAGV